MARQEFDAELATPEATGSWTFFVPPFRVAEVFGRKGQLKVRGTINGVPFRSSLAPRGDGTHYMVVNREVREAAGVGRGDTVHIVLEEDTEPRTVAVPPDLQAALDADPAAAAAFERLAYTHRREYIQAVGDAKRPETRARRIAQTIAALKAGKKELR